MKSIRHVTSVQIKLHDCGLERSKLPKATNSLKLGWKKRWSSFPTQTSTDLISLFLELLSFKKTLTWRVLLIFRWFLSELKVSYIHAHVFFS